MKYDFFEYEGKLYPSYIKHGLAADYIIPFAKRFCKGKGLDIGGIKECHFPDAGIINQELPDEYHATNLPDVKYDYIFSSHTLEHIENYLETLLYWRGHLKENGVLFLYLPHPDMAYWRPKDCKKHRHCWLPENIILAMQGLGFKDIFSSKRDLYWSFAVVGINRE